LRKSLLAVVVLALPWLAACGEIPRPFQPEFKAEDNPLLMPVDRAGIVVKPVAGLPPQAAEAFTTALVDALRREDVAAMSGTGTAASLVLTGTADSAASSGWDMTLALADARDTPIGKLTTHANPTAADDPKAWQSYAASLAKSFADMLQTAGTQVADQTTVAIGNIEGLSNDDSRAVARALEYTLKRAQVKVAEATDKPTHIVAGALAIGPPRGAAGRETRKIDVLWVVMHADKSEIGEIRQSNDVPARSIDREWPDIALAVADSATESITGLLKRAAQTR
jgi:hypothetical protein